MGWSGVTQLALDRLVIDGENVLLPLQGHTHALVESRSRPGQFHSVSYEFDDRIGKDAWCCTCESGSFRGDCRHIRAVDRWNAGKARVEFE